ncbi:hypothetical protein [Novosphingobium huizhouense]|uniref:hypothetical protein n=1 Tax=Novosphingobium huizhouense TaxID=2866625 RepID=UPI001CD87A7E|nr:hypothetical protein [Novosphingobium huizhouense]
MTADEWRAFAMFYLEHSDEERLIGKINDPSSDEAHLDHLVRWNYAKKAWPGITQEQFYEIQELLLTEKKRGRPPRPVQDRAEQKIWRAARDAEILKALWKRRNPQNPCPKPPVHPHEIAGQRHGYSKQQVDEAMRRPNSRRLDRIATAQK